MLPEINKSLLDSTDDYIMHQINCKTTTCAGLAKVIFDAYPEANIYNARVRISLGLPERTPSDAYITNNPRKIIHVAGQRWVGNVSESSAQRLVWFK